MMFTVHSTSTTAGITRDIFPINTKILLDRCTTAPRQSIPITCESMCINGYLCGINTDTLAHVVGMKDITVENASNILSISFNMNSQVIFTHDNTSHSQTITIDEISKDDLLFENPVTLTFSCFYIKCTGDTSGAVLTYTPCLIDRSLPFEIFTFYYYTCIGEKYIVYGEGMVGSSDTEPCGAITLRESICVEPTVDNDNIIICVYSHNIETIDQRASEIINHTSNGYYILTNPPCKDFRVPTVTAEEFVRLCKSIDPDCRISEGKLYLEKTPEEIAEEVRLSNIATEKKYQLYQYIIGEIEPFPDGVIPHSYFTVEM